MAKFPCPQCRQERGELEAVCPSCGWKPGTPQHEPKPPGEPEGLLEPHSPAPLVLWVVGCLCLDVVMMLGVRNLPLGRGYGMLGMVGVLAGQFAAVNIWTVFGPGRFLLRWIGGLVVALIGLFVIFVVEMMQFMPLSAMEALLQLLMSLPLVMLAVQSTLWAARILAGWHFEDARLPGVGRSRQFQIRDVMQATGLIAVAMALFMAPLQPARFGTSVAMDLAATRSVLSMGMFAGWALLFVLPLVFSVGIPRETRDAVVWSIGIGLLAPMGVAVTVQAASGTVNPHVFGTVALATLVQGGVIFLTLMLVRGSGYRLVRT